MKILLTGASGFLGSHILRSLTSMECDVIAVGDPDRYLFGSTTDNSKTRWVEDALESAEEATHALLVGSAIDMSTSTEGWELCVENNVSQFAQLVAKLAEGACSKVVFTSSAGLYRRPASQNPVDEHATVTPLRPYWTTKLLAEQLLLSDKVRAKLNPTILRLSSPYGRLQKPRTVLSLFVNKAKAGEAITLCGAGTRSQDFIHVEDAARAHLDCLFSSVNVPGICNLGSGQETSMVELAQLAIKLAGSSTSEVSFGPDDGSDGDRFWLEIGRLREYIGFSPRSLHTGLVEFFEEV